MAEERKREGKANRGQGSCRWREGHREGCCGKVEWGERWCWQLKCPHHRADGAEAGAEDLLGETNTITRYNFSGTL